MKTPRNNLIQVQDYLAEAIRANMPDFVNSPGHGFAYAVNLLLALQLGEDSPKSAREKMSERQKLRWQSERAKKDEIERKAEAAKERKREARKVKKAEAEHGEK